MTQRLYYDDAYQLEFEARVVESAATDQGTVEVVLDRSAFYPTSGGQMHDQGSLDGRAVIDVFERGEEVVHTIEGGEVLPVESRIGGRVDEARRRHHRQQHTGQHVLSRIIEDATGLVTVSSRLGETGNTLDLEIDAMGRDQLDRFEKRCDRIIQEARPVTIRFLSPEDATADITRLGKLPDRDGALRVIDIEGHDLNACGGTHCRNTAEIGLVAITRTERVKGGLRFHFHCGDRALDHRRRRDELVSKISARLTTGEDELETAVAKLYDEAKDRAKRLTALARQLVQHQAIEWLAYAPTVERESGPVRVVVQVLEGDLAEAQGEAMARLCEEPDVLAVLILPQGDRCQVVMGRGNVVSEDCGTLLRKLLELLNGRGGGKPDRSRGGFPGNAEDGARTIATQLGLPTPD